MLTAGSVPPIQEGRNSLIKFPGVEGTRVTVEERDQTVPNFSKDNLVQNQKTSYLDTPLGSADTATLFGKLGGELDALSSPGQGSSGL